MVHQTRSNGSNGAGSHARGHTNPMTHEPPASNGSQRAADAEHGRGSDSSAAEDAVVATRTPFVRRKAPDYAARRNGGQSDGDGRRRLQRARGLR